MVYGTRVAFNALRRPNARLRLPGAALLIASSLQLFCGSEAYAQQTDSDAAMAAKAAAAQEARTHIAIPDFPRLKDNFITFDVPGAVNGTTSPASINAEGAITGTYNDVNNLGHGFLRSPDGIFTTIDVPGAVDGTSPASINDEGMITGTYYDVSGVGHGFLRRIDRTFATFDAPGALSGMIGTFPTSINAAGAITGYYDDVNFVAHSFLRTGYGTLTAFDVPGAGTTTFPQGTEAAGINAEGVIIGVYTDASNGSHGFLRARNGSFTIFDPPGPVDPYGDFYAGYPEAPLLSMNPEGVITGTYFQVIAGNPFGGNNEVFVRARDGTFVTFNAATYAPCCIFSYPSGITPEGAITGSFNDGFNINHGFLRARDGTVTTFDVPGAGTGNYQGTVPLGITPAGVIMGRYIDTNKGYHGFIFLPCVDPESTACPD